jgi:hypothetical protein
MSRTCVSCYVTETSQDCTRCLEPICMGCSLRNPVDGSWYAIHWNCLSDKEKERWDSNGKI